MKNKQKVWIRGVEGRGNEVLNALKAVGGKLRNGSANTGDVPYVIYTTLRYKHSHKYYKKCQKRYDGFFSIIKVDPHIFLQHPKVAYVIDKKDLINPKGFFSIKDF